jgi:hypothetical protein
MQVYLGLNKISFVKMWCDKFIAYERNMDDKWLKKSRLAEYLWNESYYFTLKIQHM